MAPRPGRLPVVEAVSYPRAHSAVRGYRLLTRDAARYRTYCPTVTLIAPGDNHDAEGDEGPPALARGR